MPWALPIEGLESPLGQKLPLCNLECSRIGDVLLSLEVEWTQGHREHINNCPLWEPCLGESIHKMQKSRCEHRFCGLTLSRGTSVMIRSHYSSFKITHHGSFSTKVAPPLLERACYQYVKRYYPQMHAFFCWDINPAGRFSSWKSKEHFSVQWP